MADPWESDPVVRQRNPRAVQVRPDGTRYGVVAESYTNETPEQLAQAGYTLDPATGSYARTVANVPDPSGGAAPPWEADPILTDSQRLAASEAERRLGANGDTAARESTLMNGLLLGGADEVYGRLAQGGQMATNLGRRLQGLPIEINSSDLNDATVQAYRQTTGDFAQEHPWQAGGLTLAGGALTGGATVGAGVAGAVGTGLAYGAASGLNSATGSFADRLPSAALGAAVGGVTGGVIQGGAQVVAPYAQRLAGIAGAAVNPGGAARAATRRMGPAVGAATRLEGVIGPENFAERARLQALGLQPSVLDTFGNQGERLIRNAAGPAGPGADLAVQNSVARTANLKPEIMDVTRGLSRDPRSLEGVREGLTDVRSNLAGTQYAPAYATRVPVSEDILSAIGDEPGRAALRRARSAAVARRNDEQVAEIDGLLNGSTTEVTAGTLDRVRIAMAGRGRDLNQRPGSRDIAGGLFSRADDIDTALSNVPEIAPARATYADLSGALDNLDDAASVFNTNPADFAQRVQNMTPTQREAMVIGVRQRIMDALGGQREAGTGALQAVAEAPYSRENLAALLGPQEAEQYIGRIQEGVRQAQRAARVSPNTNSQTFGRTLDDETQTAAGMVGAAVDGGQALTGNLVAIGRTIDRIRARATLSPEERGAIVQLGIGSADDLERIVQVAEMARRQGRGPPRAVREYLTTTRNVLGSNSPVTQQLERLLLPSRVSAEEEQQ